MSLLELWQLETGTLMSGQQLVQRRVAQDRYAVYLESKVFFSVNTGVIGLKAIRG
jgi:hypothetical protein